MKGLAAWRVFGVYTALVGLELILQLKDFSRINFL